MEEVPAGEKLVRTVAIVPHTHWDREWYAPFQTFRLRLVDLLDEFLPLLETDLGYARFLLDGQMAVVDDYLEVRPEAEATLRRLAAGGRVTMGPWYILMDEFCVSGETIVRNLQMGMARAAAFGGASTVGYLPDMFGHIAQMPQILAQAGLHHAVVWRGVPSDVDRSAFWWSAPDGSTVRAEYLLTGYGNGAAIPDDAKALVGRVTAHEAELERFLFDRPQGGILFMNGTDHQVPQPWLGRVVAEANQIQDDYRFEVTSLGEYLPTAPTEGLPSWRGELRSSARANLLMGVTSNRVDVKQAAARTERVLERMAEPLCALFLPADRWPSSLLDLAWKEVVRNSAHDSICACSADEVGKAVLHRFAEAGQIAGGLAGRALAALGSSMAEAGPVVVNPSARTRGGLVELTLAGEGGAADKSVQVLEERPAVLADLALTGRELGGFLGQIRSQQLDDGTFVNRVEVEEGDDGIDIVLHAGAELRTEMVVEEVKRDLYARAGARPDIAWRVRIEQPPSRKVLARVENVPGFGWEGWQPDALVVDPVRVDGDGAMTNGLVTVEVDRNDGTFAIDGLAGFDRLVDGGDHGDTYNWSPPENDAMVDAPSAITVDVVERGPLRARLSLRRTFVWPEEIDDTTRARTGGRRVVVTTMLELRAGERLVRVDTAFDNPCRDHRLRTHFPLPEPATTSRAECAFAVVERGLTAEGGPTEQGLPTFPSRRFVQAGGLTVVHEGLLEYELVDIDNERAATLALTLLRATGMLSRVEMTTRPLPAGPSHRLRGPQMLGPVQARYGLKVGEVDPFALVDEAFLPLQVVTADGGGHRAGKGSALEVTGAEVSALRRTTGGLELRLFNPTDHGVTVAIAGAGTGWLVDLRGRPLRPFDGSFEMGPWAIATAHLPS
ncbi:MAG TPA: glycoside hydrolase family 38 C-terminal domain-containing protein [Acidimicrobiales bacterium]|nr:glycoside hydrolase family 38 C-terminal domain-containing protein [Acidimicrobiales bacterium]